MGESHFEDVGPIRKVDSQKSTGNDDYPQDKMLHHVTMRNIARPDIADI